MMLAPQAPACLHWNQHTLLRQNASFDSESAAPGWACGVWDTFKAAPVTVQVLPAVAAKGSSGLCDKCDGPHPTEQCPHFKKAREQHEDAYDHLSSSPGRRRAAAPVPRRVVDAPRRLGRYAAQVVRMPGDGSCLFHSLAFGLRSLGGQEDGRAIRQTLADFIARNPDVKIGSNTVRTWVNYDSQLSVSAYASRLAAGSQWGGAIEMASCAQLFQVDVVVYEQDMFGNLDLISDFLSERRPRGVVKVAYSGRMHYDAVSASADRPTQPWREAATIPSRRTGGIQDFGSPQSRGFDSEDEDYETNACSVM